MIATNWFSPDLASHRTAAAAKQCLESSPYHGLREVLCVCDNGVLLLTGRLSSFYYKQLAQEAVSRVEGMTQVVNDIEVVSADRRQPHPVSR